MRKRAEIVLEPNKSWIHIDWRSIIEYRDLLRMLVWRDYAVKHKQTVLGPTWTIINPVLTTLIFTVVFGGIAKISTDGLPPILFYLCGLLGWNYFSRTLQQTSSCFVQNASIFEKVYFPRLVVPLATATSNLVAFGIQFATFAAFWTFFRFWTDAGTELSLNPKMLFVPLLLVHAGVLAVGIGLWIATVTAKYRDLLQILNLIIQLWMYATPVIYPLSEAPERYRWLVALNPAAPLIESFRYLLLGEGLVEPVTYSISAGVAAIVFITGVMIFQRTERTFIDTI